MLGQPKNVRKARKQITPELKAEVDKVKSMYNMFGKQTKEYITVAKNINKKLRDAGLESLCVVEKCF